MPIKPDKTTVQISKATMKELKIRAIEGDFATSTDYLEDLIRNSWNERNKTKPRSTRNTRKTS